MNLETICAIPLDQAYLCPQCDCICNTHECCLCHSDTLVLAVVLNRTEAQPLNTDRAPLAPDFATERPL